MGSKKKFFEPITGTNINRAIDLCKSTPEKLKKFQEDIRYLDSNQLFQKQFIHQLLVIVNDLEELNQLLLIMAKPKDIYYYYFKRQLNCGVLKWESSYLSSATLMEGQQSPL